MRYTLAGGQAYEAENVALGYGGKSTAESLNPNPPMDTDGQREDRK